MTVRLLTKDNFPKVSTLDKEFNVEKVLNVKMGKIQMVEFFGTDGVFRAFGKNKKEAFKKAKKVAKRYYKDEEKYIYDEFDDNQNLVKHLVFALRSYK